MAKKTVKKKKLVKKKASVKKVGPNASQIEHLELLMKLSLQLVDGKSESMDAIFQEQADKIKGQIKKLKE